MKSSIEAKYLRLLMKVDKIINSKYLLNEIIRKIYEAIDKSLHVKNFYIGFYNLKDNAPNFEVLIENNAVKKVSSKSLSYGLVQRVIKYRKPLSINRDFDKFFRKLRFTSKPEGKVPKSWLGVPIIYKDNIAGAVSIYDKNKENAFSRYDAFLLSSIGTRIAMIIENLQLWAEADELSLIDPLTKIANRRYFDLILEREMKRSVKYSRSLSLAMIVLDNLKKLEQKYGDRVRDKILTKIASYAKRSIRDTDFIARYSDAELILILPETNNDGVKIAAERIRSSLEMTRVTIRGAGKKRITVSIGVATYPYNAETLAELIRCVYETLAQARKKGENTVVSI